MLYALHERNKLHFLFYLNINASLSLINLGKSVARILTNLIQNFKLRSFPGIQAFLLGLTIFL